jgi:hypothetical protein
LTIKIRRSSTETGKKYVLVLIELECFPTKAAKSTKNVFVEQHIDGYKRFKKSGQLYLHTYSLCSLPPLWEN